MAEEYVLIRDIIYDHNARMLNIKKYYPYFRLMETDFSLFKSGKYEALDMGYILMAVIRFFIEENNFKEKNVSYEEYEKFVSEIYRRDFDLDLVMEEEKEISSYIFDKLKNDGKPFVYKYFDPVDKKRKEIRIKILDSLIIDNNISYNLTSDAIEFYLDTKEIKDESVISISQMLLEKMISSRNFKGGTEVIKRINAEVTRLKMRKNEVLNLLNYDVFEGIKAYEDFLDKGIRWFEDENRLFDKNIELIKETLKSSESQGETEGIREIYELEKELRNAILRHGELLKMCTSLQFMADEIIYKAKFKKLRRNFSFEESYRYIAKKDDMSLFSNLINPLLNPHVKKSFNLLSIDKMLTLQKEREEKVELNTKGIETEYIYLDEVEDNRIESNFIKITRVLLEYMGVKDSFNLPEFNEYLVEKFGNGVLKNSDYYSMLIHLNHKKEYLFSDILKKQETFFESYLYKVLKEIKDEELKNIGIKITPVNKYVGKDFGETFDILFEKINLEG